MKKWLIHIVFVFIWCNFFAQVASGRLADFHWSTTENRHVHSAILPLIRQSSTFDSLVPWIDSTDKKDDTCFIDYRMKSRDELRCLGENLL